LAAELVLDEDTLMRSALMIWYGPTHMPKPSSTTSQNACPEAAFGVSPDELQFTRLEVAASTS
jgi:hypothetical protein